MLSQFKSRQLVLQALYIYDIHVGKIDKERLQLFEWSTNTKNEQEEKMFFARNLLLVVIDNIREIDKIFLSHIDQRKREGDVGVMDRAILRMAVSELRFFRTEPKIVIDEAVKLAKKFSSENSYKLINGILDSVMKEMKEERE